MEASFGDFNWLVALGIFAAYFFIDILYANYTLFVVEKKAVQAAGISALIYMLLAVGILSYTNNLLYLMPLVLGAWLGTYLAVRRHRSEDSD